MTGSADTDGGENRYARLAILRRVPNSRELTDLQKDLLVTAIRNPNAAPTAISEHVDDGNLGSLNNVLTRFELGGFDETPDHHPRLARGDPVFKDLTVKQRAVVDFHARHPNARDDVTLKEAARLIGEELDVTLSPNTVALYRSDYPDQIARRRKWYDGIEPEAIERLGEQAEAPNPGQRVPVRQRLLDAGFEDLPDRNLDDLPTAEEVEQRRHERISDTKRGRSRRSSAPDGDADAGIGGGDTVEHDVGGRRYRGPAEGVNLAGDSPGVSVFELASADAGDELSEGFREALDEAGPFGEDAYKRDVSIDDRDDLEAEIRQLRMVVSAQGSLLRTLKQTLESIDVSVAVSVTPPDDPDTDDGS